MLWLLLPDRQILSHDHEIALLRAVGAGRVIRGARSAHTAAPYLLDGETVRLDLAWLARQDRITMPLGGQPQLLPRGRRILRMANGEIPPPQGD